MGIWIGPLDKLLSWCNYLISIVIQLLNSIDHSESEIPFLDTLIYVKNNRIKTKLYKKATNKKQYLSYNCEYPAHMKKSIPYAQALQYRRIIQDDDILDQELINLQENFKNKGYPPGTTNEQIIKARNLKRLNTINCI